MTRTEIIELVNMLAEHKFKKFNIKALYNFVLTDICKRERFWWRRKVFNFSATANTQTFDLTSVVTSPANAMQEILLDEITKFTLILTPNPLQTAEFVPTFDPETLIDMINNTQPAAPNNPSTSFPGAGGRYTMDPSGVNVVRIDPLDINYTAYIVGWAMPNPSTDSANDSVPLIPVWGHNTIVAGMNAKIFKFAYGSKNEKTIDAKEEYEQGLQDLSQRKNFDPNLKVQLTMSESAVRST